MRFFIVLFLSILYSPSIFALTGETDENIFSPCSDLYEISGQERVTVGSTHEYQIFARTEAALSISGSIDYVLKRDGEIREEVSDTKYIRNFRASGALVIEARLPEQVWCTGILEKNIAVYTSSLTYLGEPIPEIESGMRDIFEKNTILFRSFEEKIAFDDTKREDIINALIDTDILIIGSSDLLTTFSEIAKLQKWRAIDFSTKKIYIRSDYSRQFLSKLLASSLSQIGAKKAFLITKEWFFWLITRISSGLYNPIEINAEELSYEKDRFIISLGGFLQYLSYAWFSYSLIAFLLSLASAVLILNILKQIIGMNVFGIYYPILFAIILSILGPASLSFIVIGFLSILIVNLFTRKVHLLVNAKRSLLISLYIVLFFFFIGIDNFLELQIINYSLFTNNLIIFPIFIAIILADKIFQDDIDLGTRVGLIDLFQYTLITTIVYLILQNKTLQYILISYPDSLIWLVILNILVGRYMGLQLLEYFRFSPLLRKLQDQEE